MNCKTTTFRWRRGRGRFGSIALLAAAASLLLSACASGSSGSSAGGQTTITVGRVASNDLPELVFNVADQEGFFKKQGLNVKFVNLNGDAATIPALTSGSVQLTGSTSTPTLIAMSKGEDVQMLSGVAYAPAELVMSAAAAKKAGITNSTPIAQRVKAMKGLTTGVLDVGGGLQYQLNGILNNYGVNPSAVPPVTISPYLSEVAALGRGSVPAIIPSAPYGEYAVASQHAVMVANAWDGQVPGLSQTLDLVLDVQGSWAKSNPATVKKFLAALQQAFNYVHTNLSGTAAIAQSVVGSAVPMSVLKTDLQGGAGFAKNSAITQAQYAHITQLARQSGQSAAAHISYTQAVSATARQAS